MQVDFKLKDLTVISDRVDICKVTNKYIISAYTNKLEGEINAFIRIDNSEDGSLGRTVLFSFRNGEQICTSDLSYDQQLIIPQEDLDKIKNSLSVGFEIFGQLKTSWTTTITKINSKHNDDNGSGSFTKIPEDLPIPDFKYVEVKKDSFFSKLTNVFKKN